MPRMCSWDAPLGQTRREAAAGAAIICSKLSFRPATRARRPSTPRARGGARDPSPAFVPTCADGAFDGAHKRTRTARYGWSRVRLCTRAIVACTQTDTSCPHSPRGRPLAHAAALVARECGRRGARTGLRASGEAHARGTRARSDATRLRRPPTRPHAHAAASVARLCARVGSRPALGRRVVARRRRERTMPA